MGWSNGPKTWSELEARLSDGRLPAPRRTGDHQRPHRVPAGVPGRQVEPAPAHPADDRSGDGSDSPAWSRKRVAYEPPAIHTAVRSTVPYAELSCHSNFSFLDGASHPEELVQEAVRLGLSAVGLTDVDGLYGVVRFAEAARAHGLATVFGVEFTLDTAESYAQRVGRPDVVGDRLIVLAQDPIGYGRLARAVSTSHLAAGEKGAPQLALEELAAIGRGSTAPFHRALAAVPSNPIGDAVRELTGVADTPVVTAPVIHLGERRSEFVDGDAAALDAAVRRHPAAGPHHSAPPDDLHWYVLTGGPDGAVCKALYDAGPRAAEREVRRLIERFGQERVVVSIWDHGEPLDAARNDALADLAARCDLQVVATNFARYATQDRRPLATALAAVKARRSLDEVDGWLPAASSAYLRSGSEQQRRFARYPGAVDRAVSLAETCAFDLALVAPSLPPFPCPQGHHEMSWLRELTERGAVHRYGTRDNERVAGAYAQIDHELALIEQLGFAGYFLIVWDLTEFCRRANIYAQGRGSAANSAACYALGITAADAVSLGLLFERFLSPERDGPPDIDIDIESGRREEVIQYVYTRYGRENAAQVANVITYRSRSAIRDMGRALGHSPGQLDAWGKQVDGWGRVAKTADQQVTDRAAGLHNRNAIPESVLALAAEVEDFPRHLGIHSGGMVICDRPVVEVCPVEWGRFSADAEHEPQTSGSGASGSGGAGSGGAGSGGVLRRGSAAGRASAVPLRTVLQWDKDDCAAAGLVKFDLLGLGMLSALHYGVDLIRAHHGVEVDLALIPQEDEVYEMLCHADTVGVFQIESRAQMATLPRLKPRRFYDLVVEVALIRPGPIQGGSVHPFIRRRNGQEPVTYLHPLLEKSLAKTLGIPLFQEQLMQMAIDVANFTPAEADQLRQAMGNKRSPERMARLRQRFDEGCQSNGVTPDVIDILWEKLAAFANYGFPESHSVSFAYLVYSSSWMKYHYPAAFCAALLNAQPMGFYSPQSLTADARRHGVNILGPHINASNAAANLEWPDDPPEQAAHSPHTDPAIPQPSVRLGLSEVRHVGVALAERIEQERIANGPYTHLGDVARRTEASTTAMQALATSGAFTCFTSTDGQPMDRRRALWAVGAVVHDRPDRLEGIVTGADAPTLPGMDTVETMAADLWATGVTPNGYPTELLRDELTNIGVVASERLREVEHGRRVRVAGIVTHRQRPATAGGTTFINLEDETGLINVIVSKQVWARYRSVAQGAAALLIRGRLERTETVSEAVSNGENAMGPAVINSAGRVVNGENPMGPAVINSAGRVVNGENPMGPAVINIVADRIDRLSMSVTPGPSRDFR
jgi:error-prone DNA polymerase